MDPKTCRDEFVKKLGVHGSRFEALLKELDRQIKDGKTDRQKVQSMVENLLQVHRMPQTREALVLLKDHWGASPPEPFWQQVKALLTPWFKDWRVVNSQVRKPATPLQQENDGKLVSAVNIYIATGGRWQTAQVKQLGMKVQKNQAGCCTTLSLAVAARLLDRGFADQHRIEIAGLKNHIFLIVDRVKGMEKNPDPKSWGSSAFVVDLWMALCSDNQSFLGWPAVDSNVQSVYRNCKVFYDSAAK